MIALVASWLVPVVGAKAARAAAWAAIVIAAVLLLWGAKALYDSSVIQGWINKNNAEQLEELNESTGEADVESGDRKQRHDEKVRTTGELVDEALEKGCAVGEYLASNGANCVR
jgi:hypothetical protein